MNVTIRKRVKLYVFFCSNSVDVHEVNARLRDTDDFEYKPIGLPCSGKANLLYLVKAFETGADGLLLVTCGKNQCRYLEGNLRSPRRAEEVNSLLREIGMGADRIAVMAAGDEGVSGIMTRLSQFGEQILHEEAPGR